MISRRIFHDPEIYERELELIFRKSWLLVGHESQIPNVGDFFLSRMGEDQVILSRSRDGKANVFLNTCRHKGMRVCRYDEGNTKVFVCPYHAWTYDLNGDLRGVPEKESYPESYRPRTTEHGHAGNSEKLRPDTSTSLLGREASNGMRGR